MAGPKPGWHSDGVQCSSRRLESPIGDVTITRLLYQAPGVEELAPMDAALGLTDEHYGAVAVAAVAVRAVAIVALLGAEVVLAVAARVEPAGLQAAVVVG